MYIVVGNPSLILGGHVKNKAKKLFLSVASIAVASTALFAPLAHADQISNWTLKLPGGPMNTDINNLAFGGEASIINSSTDGINISFKETGVFNALAKNGGPALSLGGGQLTGDFNGVTGQGTLGGGVTFNAGGTLDIYYSPTVSYGSSAPRYGATAGTKIATFTELAGGGGAVNPDGTPSSNGQFTLNFVATYLDPGVWFDSNNNPLATGITFGFVTTNASEDLSYSCPGKSCNPDSNLLTGLGASLNDQSATPGHFIVSNGGQFKLDTQAVPEPGSVALLGLGMLGLMVMRRRPS